MSPSRPPAISSPSEIIKSALYYSKRLQQKLPVNHDILPQSLQMEPMKANCKKYFLQPKMEKTDDIGENLERNQVHYAFVYHALVKAVRAKSWNRMKAEWRRDNKTHTPDEMAEMLTAINRFTALMLRPVFYDCVPYNPEKLKVYLLNGHVPEEQILALLSPPGASPRFRMRMDSFFIHFQNSVDLLRNEWNSTIIRGVDSDGVSQEFQTVSHALGALSRVFEVYLE